MDIGEYLSVGDRLDIYYNDEVYKSQVDNIASKDTLIIAHPMKKMSYIKVAVNDEMHIICSKDSGVVGFKCTLVQRVTEDNFFQLMIRIISPPQKVQRRDFFRLSIAMKMGIVLSGNYDEGREVIYTVTKDISAGGAGFWFNKHLRVGTELFCTFKVDKDDAVVLKAKVVRSNEVNDPKGKYSIGIQFINCDEKTRQRIIRFIFESQIKLQSTKS